MPIDEKDSHLTAFTVQGQGQFEWVTSLVGLLGYPASFQRLMEKVLHGIKSVIVYLDNVIVHTATHEHHLQVLEEVCANCRNTNYSSIWPNDSSVTPKSGT